jgi:hypothetical protein
MNWLHRLRRHRRHLRPSLLSGLPISRYLWGKVLTLGRSTLTRTPTGRLGAAENALRSQQFSAYPTPGSPTMETKPWTKCRRDLRYCARFDRTFNMWSIDSNRAAILRLYNADCTVRVGRLQTYREHEQVILFGGAIQGNTVLGDTWAWNGTAQTWTQLSPATSPSPRGFAGMSSGGATGSVVLFGGGDYTQNLGDT